MEEDEEVVLKGSALYNYLSSKGYNNFESLELYPKKSFQLLYGKNNDETTVLAPKWASDHLCSVLKCGLILDDHRHFVECFLPLQTRPDSPYRIILLLSSISWTTTLGSILHFMKRSFSSYSAALGIFSSVGALYFTKKVLSIHLHAQSLNRLRLMLGGLEDLLVQLKRMVFLVQQNELIAHSFSLHFSEMVELRKCVWKALNTSIKDMFEFCAVIKEVPLAYDVDSTLNSFSEEDMSCVPSMTDDSQLTMDSLKKLFNTYILIQSEFLRRLALCYCPEMWCTNTMRHVIIYSNIQFSKIEQWSKTLCSNLVQEYKLFRSLGCSRGRQTPLRIPVISSWDFSDLYVAVRSASLHLQSILVQSQDIEDLLESKDSLNWKDNKEFLKSIAQILIDIQKELRSCHACFDDSLVQVLKMTNHKEVHKLVPQEGIHNPEEQSAGLCPDSEVNPEAEDEVFELLVPLEGENNTDEDGLNDETDEDRDIRVREREASKRVLQELKVVLVKKADEWREREKRAMESKGMVYSAAEQVRSIEGKENVDHPGDLDWLPTEDQIAWPLPRLKGNIPTHRSSGERSRPVSSHLEAQLQPSDLRKARADELKETCQDVRPKLGFDASLLAEAMQKSLRMNFSKTEDVYLDSGDEHEDLN